MKYLILIAALISGCAVAEPSEYLTGDALQAEVSKLCSSGCIVFSPAEIEALQAAIRQEVAQRQQATFDAGKASEKEICRNAI